MIWWRTRTSRRRCSCSVTGGCPRRKELEAHHVKALSRHRRTAGCRPSSSRCSASCPKKTTPMEALRTGVSALSAFDPDAADNSRDATLRKVHAADRADARRWWRRGSASDAARRRWRRIRSLDLAANFLYMMSGKKPTDLASQDLRRRAHPPRRSRVQRVDLRRPRHRGHPVRRALRGRVRHRCAQGPASRRRQRAGDAAWSRRSAIPPSAEVWIRKALADKMRIMGFGHRVYRVEDPRAKHLRRLALELGPARPGTPRTGRDPRDGGARGLRRQAHLPERRPLLGRGLLVRWASPPTSSRRSSR